MDEFSYLSVLLSIIVGLAIAQLLQGLTGVIQARERVRLYGPALIWAVLLIVVAIQMWWAMFGLRTRHEWSFLGFGIVILQTILLFVATALVLPSFNTPGTINLRGNYFGHSRWFFATWVSVLVVSLVKDVVLSGSLPGALNLAFHLVGIVTGTVAATTRNDRFHRYYAVFVAALFGLYIAVLFARLH